MSSALGGKIGTGTVLGKPIFTAEILVLKSWKIVTGAGSSACLERGGAGGVDHSLYAGEAQGVGQQPNLAKENLYMQPYRG